MNSPPFGPYDAEFWLSGRGDLTLVPGESGQQIVVDPTGIRMAPTPKRSDEIPAAERVYGALPPGSVVEMPEQLLVIFGEKGVVFGPSGVQVVVDESVDPGRVVAMDGKIRELMARIRLTGPELAATRDRKPGSAWPPAVLADVKRPTAPAKPVALGGPRRYFDE